jgi:hypothetical protein
MTLAVRTDCAVPNCPACALQAACDRHHVAALVPTPAGLGLAACEVPRRQLTTDPAALGVLTAVAAHRHYAAHQP